MIGWLDTDRTTSTLIIGGGNWYRSDDAVGLVVARRIKAMRLFGVEVCEGSGEGSALMDAWNGAQNIIIIDASSSGLLPGTILTLDAQAQSIPSAFLHYSSHAFGVAEAIELARALKQLPPRLMVFGIEGKNFAAGIGLSAEVEKAVGEVVSNVIDQIQLLGADR